MYLPAIFVYQLILFTASYICLPANTLHCQMYTLSASYICLPANASYIYLPANTLHCQMHTLSVSFVCLPANSKYSTPYLFAQLLQLALSSDLLASLVVFLFQLLCPLQLNVESDRLSSRYWAALLPFLLCWIEAVLLSRWEGQVVLKCCAILPGWVGCWEQCILHPD